MFQEKDGNKLSFHVLYNSHHDTEMNIEMNIFNIMYTMDYGISEMQIIN